MLYVAGMMFGTRVDKNNPTIIVVGMMTAIGPNNVIKNPKKAFKPFFTAFAAFITKSSDDPPLFAEALAAFESAAESK